MGTYTLPEGFTEFDMFAFGSALLVGGLLGFFLNIISILSFLTVREMRNPSNFFVFNLAVADISLNINGLTAAYASYLRVYSHLTHLVHLNGPQYVSPIGPDLLCRCEYIHANPGANQQPERFANANTEQDFPGVNTPLALGYWPFGQDGCSFHAFQGMISVLASLSFMAVIAWDRYHQYCTRQKLFWSTTLTISGLIWILAIFWSALPLMGWGVYDFEPMRTCCTLDYTRGDRDYITYVLSLVFLYLMFPSITLISCYNSIYKQFKKVHHHRFNTSLPMKVMLMCWGPYILMCIYACFENVKVISPKLRMLLPVIAKTNPFFNALFYSFGNEFYRGGIWHFLTGQKIVEPDIKKSK